MNEPDPKPPATERIAVTRDSGGVHLVTKRELASIFQVTSRTVENWQHRGHLPFIKVGRVVRFDVTEVMAALKSSHQIRRGRRLRLA